MRRFVTGPARPWPERPVSEANKSGDDARNDVEVAG